MYEVGGRYVGVSVGSSSPIYVYVQCIAGPHAKGWVDCRLRIAAYCNRERSDRFRKILNV